jgi:uncharacterized protein (TIGR03437 family)
MLNRIAAAALPLLCAVTFLHAQTCIAPPSGLVSWWPGDANENDIIGGNNPSAVSAVSLVPAEVLDGFTFGGDGYIQIPSSPSLANQTFTWSAWVDPEGPGPTNDRNGSVIVNQITSTQGNFVQLSWSASSQQFVFVFGDEFTEFLLSNDTFAPGAFYLVAGSYDGSVFRLFVNGVLEGSFTETTTVSYSSSGWHIGGNISAQQSFRTWNGVIDEVQAFNRALSQSELQAIFNAGSAGECKGVTNPGSIPQFTISTIAGNGTAGYSGDGGPALNAELNNPHGIAVDAAGNLYIADKLNSRVRKVAPDGTMTTFAGTGVAGSAGDGGPAASALLTTPERVSLDATGNLYIADIGAYCVRKVDLHGVITTVAGSGQQGFCGSGGPAIAACMHGPEDVVPDAAGNLFIADFDVVWKVDTKGIITVVAGNAVQGYSGDGGPATSASMNAVQGVAVNANGDLFIADQGNFRIRKVSGGIITTIAGTGTSGFSGDGGPATSAQVSLLGNLRLDNAGDLYFADNSNCRVRVLLTNGTIVTATGDGTPGFSGDGGSALSAQLQPDSVAIAPSGSVYFSDVTNERVRRLVPVAPSIGAGGIISASAFGAFPSIAPGTFVEIYGSNLAFDTRGWSGADFNGINAPVSLDGTSVSIGGKTAFVNYISPGQVNVLVPSDAPTGQQPLTLTTAGGTASYTIAVNTVEPGLLAPPNFDIGGTQYVVALFPDYSYVLPAGAISGLSSSPAKSGDIIVLYGIGFGPVTPDIPAGQLVGEANSLATDFHIFIGGVECPVQYDGLAPSYTGLYQFNIVVPNVAAGNQPLTLTVDGVNGAQTLYVAIGN